MNSEEKRREALKASGCIPRHIAIIMDGNGRWAKSKGLPRIAGHQEGVKTVRQIVEVCAELGVEYLTLYTFSTENWNRPKEEVSTLMKLLLRTLRREIDDLNKNNIKLSTIGDISQLPDKVRDEFLDAFNRTKHNSRLQLILALSYSGRWEITEAVKKIAADVVSGKVDSDKIDNKIFENYLTTANIPDPDLLIRTGGEYRVSNFLLWQIAYTEFFISDVYWPEFKSKHLYDAIDSFQKRERRFGKVSEQIKKKKKDLF